MVYYRSAIGRRVEAIASITDLIGSDIGRRSRRRGRLCTDLNNFDNNNIYQTSGGMGMRSTCPIDFKATVESLL